MNSENLIEYIEIVVNMEKKIYMQDNLLIQMQKWIDQLGQPHVYKEPDEPKAIPKIDIFSLIIRNVMAFIGLVIFFWGLRLAYEGRFLGIILPFLGAACATAGVIYVISVFTSYSKGCEDSEKAEEIYEKKYEEYRKKVRIDNERVNNEMIVKNALSLEAYELRKQNINSRERLIEIYSKNIIFPKYRNLVMVCSIYEYLCSGRCTALEGYEGAYNILETEIRLDCIITGLDQVIARLDAIQRNQYTLYSIITKTNYQFVQILKSENDMINISKFFHGQDKELNARISLIRENSSLKAYRTQSLQEEDQYMERISSLFK